jgi:hypothetical protein
MPFSTDTKLSRYCLLLKKNPEKNKGYSSLADSIDRFDQYFLFSHTIPHGILTLCN